MEQVINIGVREIVEFLMRGGSIDSRFGGADRALEGTRIHRRLQKSEGENYRPEVFLSAERPCGDFILRISGRADGVLVDPEGAMIDEIKSTAVPAELIEENLHPGYWAQAMCYGFMYCVENQLDSIRLRLTYYQIETDDIVRFVRFHTFAELEAFFDDMVARFRRWAELRRDWTEARDGSIKTMQFPYPSYRKGQRRLAVSVYKAIRDEKTLFVQAPTGIGKTISALFPAVKAIGEGIAEKIFYLTAKTITRQVAESACKDMSDSGLRLKIATLTAKDKICFLEKRECNPEACKYAKGHYDRVNEALYNILRNGDIFDRDAIERYAEENTLCPYELSLDIAEWCDCIIADYNYVFDPQVYLRRFFASGQKHDYVFLIDEAHNLTDRAREMFSAGLAKSAFLQTRRLLDKKDKLRKVLSNINSEMLAMRKECGTEEILKKPEPGSDFIKLLFVFAAECEEWMKQHRGSENEEKLLELYFEVLSFLKIFELYDERYITLIETDGTEVLARLFCLDPSKLLGERMSQGRASVLFSATLTPLEYFRNVLGGDPDSLVQRAPSPFPRENLCLLIYDRINTRYRNRENTLQEIADTIAATAGVKTGNYIAYFPSYAYMHAVYNVFRENYPDIRTTIQSADMKEHEREEFLEQFCIGNGETLVGFCVLGGIFSEGIDLCGEKLIGAIIIGVGLPQISPVMDMIREYYDNKNGMGFAYAYMYPGMNKVLQAAGRVIRSEEDRGVVVLIDDRFTTKVYRDLMPEHWQGYLQVHNIDQLRRIVSEFWQ
jgi:DNA excision repair protein ERCC-2